MENKIVFTHDVNVERQWLSEQFSSYTNLETSSSGKWTGDFPVQNNQGLLYEIAYSDHHDLKKLLDSDCEKIKSFYSRDPEIVFRDNKYWACATSFVGNVNYTSFVDQPKFWVIHVARSGTVFAETLLGQFRTSFRGHVGIKQHDSDIIDIWQQAWANPDVALVLLYRPELWETFTSTALATKYGCHHGDGHDWSLAEAIEINVDDMLQFQSMLISTLNFWCNLRSLLPTHSFMLVNGSEIIKQYQHMVDHKKVNYNKQSLISNYQEAKEIWYEKFNNDLSKMLHNTVGHLEKMHCKLTLDHLK
jgi:hypothetical protein